MKDTVIWNIEQGSRLTGPQVGAAEVKRTQLFHRMREFMEKYDFLVAPAVQVLPFDVDVPYVTEINGVNGQLHRLDAFVLLHHRDRRAGALRSVRIQPRRTSGRPADRRPPSGRFRRACRSAIAFEQATGFLETAARHRAQQS